MTKGQKVREVTKRYDLENLGDELVEQWSNSDDPKSLHELEQYVNGCIIESILDKHLTGPVSQAYQPDRIAYILRADGSSAERFEDVSQVEITEVRNWLEQNDIDPGKFTDDLVSYNTVYQYLTHIKKVNVSDDKRHSQDPKERQRRVSTRLSNLQQRAEMVTKQGLNSLVSVGILPDNYDIRLRFQVECTECDRRQDLLGYINNQGCTACRANNR